MDKTHPKAYPMRGRNISVGIAELKEEHVAPLLIIRIKRVMRLSVDMDYIPYLQVIYLFIFFHISKLHPFACHVKSQKESPIRSSKETMFPCSSTYTS